MHDNIEKRQHAQGLCGLNKHSLRALTGNHHRFYRIGYQIVIKQIPDSDYNATAHYSLDEFSLILI